MAWSVILTLHIPKYIYDEAAAYLINHLHVFYNLKHHCPLFLHLPHVNFLFNYFGGVCFIHNHTLSRNKLDSRALRCVFIGYSLTQKEYKFYHPF